MLYAGDRANSLFEDVTLRVNFDVHGGRARPTQPSAGFSFKGGQPVLVNTKYVVQAIDPAQFKNVSQYVALTTETQTPGPVANFVHRLDCWVGGFERPGQLVVGSFRDSFIKFTTSGGHFKYSMFDWKQSRNNVLSMGSVASASRAFPLVAEPDRPEAFNGGTPIMEQGLYVSYRTTTDWRPGEHRTLYLHSQFAAGINPGTRVSCIPGRQTSNPGAVCNWIRRHNTAKHPYQVAVSLTNRSRRNITAGFTHVFCVQLGPT